MGGYESASIKCSTIGNESPAIAFKSLQWVLEQPAQHFTRQCGVDVSVKNRFAMIQQHGAPHRSRKHIEIMRDEKKC
jgi:hypothetical protein